jgi:outer membrane lipoprotein-sorting protein
LRAGLSLLLLLPLAGCYGVRTHTVNHTIVVPHVLDATVEQLITRLDTQYNAIQSLNASVDITASEGSEHTGEVKDIPTFSGFIWLRKPSDLRVLLQLPVLRSRALDMVSDGKSFKLVIPPKGKAIVGSEEVTTPSKNGLENLRPGIIRDALLIPPLGPDDLVALTEGSRLIPAPVTKHGDRKETLEEPDYDLAIGRSVGKHILERERVIHISRVTLLPYRQEIYSHGKIVTRVDYDRYQKFGDIDFPMSIVITRPIDEYKLKLDFSRLTLNQTMTDDTFVLNIPSDLVVTKM